MFIQKNESTAFATPSDTRRRPVIAITPRKVDHTRPFHVVQRRLSFGETILPQCATRESPPESSQDSRDDSYEAVSNTYFRPIAGQSYELRRVGEHVSGACTSHAVNRELCLKSTPAAPPQTERPPWMFGEVLQAGCEHTDHNLPSLEPDHSSTASCRTASHHHLGETRGSSPQSVQRAGNLFQVSRGDVGKLEPASGGCGRSDDMESTSRPSHEILATVLQSSQGVASESEGPRTSTPTGHDIAAPLQKMDYVSSMDRIANRLRRAVRTVKPSYKEVSEESIEESIDHEVESIMDHRDINGEREYAVIWRHFYE